MRYGRKRLHSPEYAAHQTQLQRDRRERIKRAELDRAWNRHEALLSDVSLELKETRNAR